jgi:4-hydroxybenzoate polyprenyltransferase
LLAAGILAASLVSALSAGIAASIAVAAVVYDRWGKHHGVLGPLNMGLCRGLNLVLGITALRHAVETTWAIALINVVYIAAVTMTSRGEVSGGRRPSAGVAVALLACVSGALVGIGLRSAHGWPAPVAIAAILAWRVLPAFWVAWREGRPETVRRAVRTGVLSLVLVDSAIGTAYAGMIYGLVILTVAFVAGRLARLFAVT